METQKGFTLIEVMIVIAIACTVLAITVPTIIKYLPMIFG